MAAFDKADYEHWCVSVSWGKDSIVLLDILLDAVPQIDILFVDRGLAAELPETPLLIQAWREYRGFNLHIVKPDIEVLDLYDELGGLPGLTVQASDSVIRERTLAPPSDAWMREHGKVGHFMGRRAEENPKTRGRHLQYRGALHFSQSRQLWTCDPLAEWSAREIWAYIVKHDLPYHPAYDLTTIDNREAIRLSSWSGMANARYGRWSVIQRHYIELWNYFTARFPDARNFV